MDIKWPKWTFSLLIGVLLIELLVPVSAIWTNQRIRNRGNVYLFACSPVDPNDPFRGKYLALHFALEDSLYAAPDHWNPGHPVFALLEKDQRNSSHITRLSATKPSSDYLMVRIADEFADEFTDRVRITLPFDRLYVEESQAGALEVRYREQLRKDLPLVAVVRILDGKAVLDGLHFGE
ncbi:MAG: GDYXXLXY domain-containing protein [Saprospiraceae bacterium]